MPGPVNGAGNTVNTAMNGAKKVATAYAKNGMQGVSNIWDQYAQSQVTGVADNLVDSTIGNNYAGAIVKGISQAIISAILGGNMSAPTSEINDAQQSLTDVQNMKTQGQKLSDDANNQAKEITNTTKASVEGGTAEIQDAVSTINNGAETLNKTLENNTTNFEENKAEIDKNKKTIELKQKELDEMDIKIKQLLSERNISVPKKEENGDNSVTNMDFSSFDFGTNSDLQELIASRKTLSDEILELQNTNISLLENITTGSESCSELLSSISEVSTEKAEFIDQKAGEILSTVTDAKGAVQELSNFLNGEFPKMDKAMATRIATIVTKGAINGTNSGVLTGLAATLGASSIFSFGSTAMQAKNAGEGALKYGTASAKDIANAAIEKTVKEMATKYMQQSMSQLSNIIGVDINEIMDMAQEMSTQAKETTINDYVADANGSQVEKVQEELDGQMELSEGDGPKSDAA